MIVPLLWIYEACIGIYPPFPGT